MTHGELTFGVELECVKLAPEAASIMQTRGFSRHYDASIRGNAGEPLPPTIEEGGGSELVTPVYKVDLSMDAECKHIQFDYGDAKGAVEDLCRCCAEINTSCGVHVHLGNPGKDGKSLWKPDLVRTMLAICTLREDKFYTLVPPSRKNNRHCLPIKSRFTDTDFQSYYPLGNVQPRKDQNPKRYCWLNLIETKRKGNDPRPGRMASEATGTIEIRMLGNTRRFDYIWAWIQLWVKIAAYVQNLSASSAMLHTCVTEASLATEFETVLRAKNATSPDRAMEILEHVVVDDEAPVRTPTIGRPAPVRQENPVRSEVDRRERGLVAALRRAPQVPVDPQPQPMHVPVSASEPVDINEPGTEPTAPAPITFRRGRRVERTP